MGLENFHKYASENEKAREYADNVLDELELDELEVTTIEFTSSLTKTAGKYLIHEKKILLSIHYLREYGWEGVTDVIRHELAHVAAIQKDGCLDHSDVFVKWSKVFDCPMWCKYMKSSEERLYVCPTCNSRWGMKDVTDDETHYCPTCGAKHGYNEKTRLRVVESE